MGRAGVGGPTGLPVAVPARDGAGGGRPRRVRDLVVVADRIGWEERRLLDAAGAAGLRAAWADDGAMCLGSDDEPPGPGQVILLRSKSFVRGPSLARMLEGAGATVVNGAAATAACTDKLQTLRALHAAGLPAVGFRLVLTRTDLDLAVARLGLPLVLKPLVGGFGRCVLLARDGDLAHSIYDYVAHHARGIERALLAQPLVSGTDVRVLAVAGRPVAAIARTPSGDWRANVAAGAEPEPWEVDDELAALVARVCELFELTVCGIDLFATGDGYLVSEVNHVPEFRGAARVTDVDIAAEIVAGVIGAAR
jgi:[lysine-biosynthesis-protein LysW]---L-2-aminoadipate ligase